MPQLGNAPQPRRAAANTGELHLNSSLTLGPVICAYVAERRQRGEIQANTAEDLMSRLSTFAESFGQTPLDALDEYAIERWLGTIGWMRPASRRSYFSTVKVFCRWMVRRHHLTSDPTVEVGKIRTHRHVPRALPAASVARLLLCRPAPRDQAVIWLMVGDGLRVAEVAGALVDDYDAFAGTLFVRGKGAHERVVPTPLIVVGALGRYLDEVGWLPGPLIRTSHRRENMRPGTISKMVTGWLYEAGVKRRPNDGITPHCLRHTCASDVLEQCGDLRVVQELLGHANLATTAIYLRLAGLSKIREAVEGRTYLEAA